MGISRLYSTQWTWGTIIGEGVGTLLLVFFIVFGKHYIRSLPHSPLMKRVFASLNIFAGILIAVFVAIAISEIYKSSASSATLNPLNPIIYSIIVQKYSILGYIITSQLIGSIIGFSIAKLFTRKLKYDPLLKSEMKLTFRSEGIRFLTVLLLTMTTILFTFLDPTIYGAGTMLKILIESFIFGVLFIVMGISSFHFFETALTLVVETYKYFYVRKDKEETLYTIKRSVLSIGYQWGSFGIILAIIFIIQAIAGSDSIANRI